MYLYFLIEVEKLWKANSSCVAFSNLNPKFTNYRNNILNWNRPITTKRTVLGEFIQWPGTELIFFSCTLTTFFFLFTTFFSYLWLFPKLWSQSVGKGIHRQQSSLPGIPEERKKQISYIWTLANNHHATTKFTAEISQNKVSFLSIILYKGNGLIS